MATREEVAAERARRDAANRLIMSLENEGRIQPIAVVDAARPEDSPLHPDFEWDDETAAERQRLDTARRLIRAAKIRVKVDDLGVIRTRRYARDPSVEESGYVSIPRLREESENARAVIRADVARAEALLESARKRALALDLVPAFEADLARLIESIRSLQTRLNSVA